MVVDTDTACAGTALLSSCAGLCPFRNLLGHGVLCHGGIATLLYIRKAQMLELDGT